MDQLKSRTKIVSTMIERYAKWSFPMVSNCQAFDFALDLLMHGCTAHGSSPAPLALKGKNRTNPQGLGPEGNVGIVWDLIMVAEEGLYK